MEKFAASAKVVGLSYDYAAASIAEVIDRTQMAPEEVGTAFKTILSRMQGLELGETLEDGVELNKYAQALDVIGVKVLDANGGLREADDILKDLGGQWDNLDSAQKKALATTVAGVRQQTQFMAIMEEWNDIEASVSDLANATGYLTEQNEKVANSVAGIKKRYEEAKNQLFDSLLDPNNLKGFYTGMEGLIKGATNLVDAFGGIGPIIITITALFSR
jgi:TP901 family phage tail tape measure protein